jgi:hypothetical protein
MSEPWNRFDAELADLLQNEASKRGTKRPCKYCGRLTTRADRVCLYCDDLPAGEPEKIIEAEETP